MKNFLLLLIFFLTLSSSFAATNCGGTSQPRCDVSVPADQQTTDIVTSTENNITQALDGGKTALENVPDNKFYWSFIPRIPTASCVDPDIPMPFGAKTFSMHICDSFNIFSVFINGVLAFFCVIGCVQQIRSALAVKG